MALNLYLPEKYIDEIEINSGSRTLNIAGLDIKKLEYDGDLKYLNVKDRTAGRIILNTTKCDIEANYDELNSIENAPNTIELNGIGSKLIVIEK